VIWMNVRLLLVCVGAAMSVAACMSTAERSQVSGDTLHAICTRAGHSPGTDDYAGCMARWRLATQCNKGPSQDRESYRTCMDQGFAAAPVGLRTLRPGNQTDGRSRAQ
jgi:hypothetical protein